MRESGECFGGREDFNANGCGGLERLEKKSRKEVEKKSHCERNSNSLLLCSLLSTSLEAIIC